MSKITDQIDKIQAKRSEADRLLKTLEFYEWLKDHSVNWEAIKGIRQMHGNHVLWSLMTKDVRTRYKRPRFFEQTSLIQFRLKDVAQVTLPWPPFDDDVILNKERYHLEEKPWLVCTCWGWIVGFFKRLLGRS